MKTRIVLISLLALYFALAVVPAMAQDLYDNGSTNGNTDAWTINFGYVVSDTFRVCCNGANGGISPDSTISGATFAMWLFPGDSLTSAELSITSSENGGTSYFDQTVNFTQSGCVGNEYGYNVCNESTSFSGPTLNAGTY
ncbi:MAG: hypothetical protein WAM65_08470, partial [Candidatus Korobacteraceae bacterium]